jgi:hypothetical protein
MYLDVTSYDSLGAATIFPLRVGTNGAMLLATGFDGIVGVAASFTAPGATTTTSLAAFAAASPSGSFSTTASVGGVVRNCVWRT